MSDVPTTAAKHRLETLLAAPGGRRVGVLGLGVSGRAMALHLRRRGFSVEAADARADVDVEGLRDAGVCVRLADSDPSLFDGVEALAISPGIATSHPAVDRQLARGVPVVGELDLVGALPVKTVAVTGTNGKSTTVAMIGALLEGLGYTPFVGGNYGEPIVSWIDRGAPGDVAVVEVSSYQLERAVRFRPNVGIVLNLAPDHLERHGSMEAYAAAKARLVECLPTDGVAVLNADDEYVAAMATKANGAVWCWSLETKPSGRTGAYRDSEDCCVGFGEAAPLGRVALAHPRLPGRHDRHNALAAFLALAGLGVRPKDTEELRQAYLGFPGLPHRLEPVAEAGGISFINDSKATNDAAAASAVHAMSKPVILLAGGRDKGSGYAALAAAAPQKLRQVIAFGEARAAIVRQLQGHVPCSAAETLDAALSRAIESARTGDVVLLSPACSSFDAFAGYAARGDYFKNLVRQWVESQSRTSVTKAATRSLSGIGGRDE